MPDSHPATTRNRPRFFGQSLWLILTNISLAVSGALFWWVASRFYSVESVGAGSAMITAASLFVFIATLGITPTLARFFPLEDRYRLFSTILGVSFMILLVLYLICWATLNLFFKSILFPGMWFPSLMLLLCIAMLFFQILDSLFIALSMAQWVFCKNVIQYFLRIAILVLAVSLAGTGIFFSNCAAAIIAIGISLLCAAGKLDLLSINFTIEPRLLRKILPFTLVNFLNSLAVKLPGLVFPLIIFLYFSKREAGLFYIPWMIYSVFCNFTISITNAFLTHASRGGNLNKLLSKMAWLMFFINCCGCLAVFFFSRQILGFFKLDFSLHSPSLLKILFLSIFFFSANQIYVTLLNVKKDVRQICIISTIIVASMIVCVILLIPSMKLEGFAWAWGIANVIGTLYAIFDLFYKKSYTFLLKKDTDYDRLTDSYIQ